jgi:xylulokinase
MIVSLVAGVDSSTQSCTVVLRDADDGSIVGTASVPHPPTTPPVSEQDPTAWWGALTKACSSLPMGDVAAISIDGQGHGLVPLDSMHNVIRPAKLWNDTTSAPEARELVAKLGASIWAERVGTVPTAAFTITKLLWLARHEPESFARLATVLLPADWLMSILTGKCHTDRSAASGTGYWSPSQGRYLPEMLALVGGQGWSPALPEVLDPNDVAGVVQPESASALGVRVGTLVGPGCNDQPPSALALGIQDGDVVISIGTSGTVFTRSATPTADATGAVTGVADATGAFLPLVCMLNAAKVTDAFARLMGVDHAGLSDLALAAPPDPQRSVVVPYFDGERTPNRPAAHGILVGLRSDLTREQVARAAFEGVICGLLDGLDALTASGAPTSGRLIVTGGGARSKAYRQFLADLSGRPIHSAEISESAASGAAIQAAAVLRGRCVLDVANDWAPALPIVAEPRLHQSRDELRARYRIAASLEELDD